jgi:AraC-like DNA-binding protein
VRGAVDPEQFFRAGRLLKRCTLIREVTASRPTIISSGRGAIRSTERKAETSRATTAPPRPAAMPAGIAVHDASPALLDGITRLLGLLDEPGAAAMLASGVKREILWRLLTGPQGATVRQIGLADSRLAHLARTITWIRGHYDQTLRVEDLAALSAMSVTSFHRHFRALTSMTPIQFQKQICLHEARTRLLADPGDIAGTGHAVGYGSPSQFSREYRRMFGVPPSRHAPALRRDT